ncbi:MAG: heparinase [Armatimonadetes bacterium]|nr:heparinase [Armatimonadota bacterium]
MPAIIAAAVLGAALFMLLGAPAGAVRDYGGHYTAERLANLRANCERYDWARAERERVVAAADPWVKLSDDELWHMIPGQKLPRTIDVSMYQGKRPGCPVCGEAINKYGNYPYNPDIWKDHFKLKCPSCQEVFPKNDFEAYYRSGINEAGVFDPDKADRSLLYNTVHPDPNDPLHLYGVDDGYGWFDENGHRHLFVAYYVWKYWDALQNGVSALANAFAYTGEQQYAHKALVMLDRIADLYPDYQWKPYGDMGYYHSDGGAKRGKIEGKIWETGTVTTFARAVDMVLSGTRDDPELYAFLAEKGRQYKLAQKKGTRELLVQNLDDGILRAGAKGVFDGDVAGNEGMTQRALAACAIALDTEPETGEWLDYLFEAAGGHIPGVIVGGIDRDGVGAEAAPGYALGWGTNMGTVADMLADYGKYTRHDIYRDFPSFKATFTAGWRIGVLGYATPNIGDSGSCGSLGLVAAAPDFIVRGYKYLQDPSIGLAAYYAADGKIAGLGRDILAADPDRIEREVQALAEAIEGQENPWQGGHNMAGYGLASIEYGWGKPGTALWMYYGRNGGHGHLDRLNFDIYYKGFCMLPDHGYPEYATNWPHRNYVTENTLSHNTVVVNGLPQKVNWVGHPELYCQLDDFGAVRVDSREVYDGVSRYQRTLAFVKIADGEGYALDVFRVVGGNDHLYSIHGLPGEVQTTGLSLTPQEQGTYAGPDVPYRTETPEGPGYGYSWVTHVARQTEPPASFVVDWKGQAGWRGLRPEDDIHLRYHSLSDLADVALGDMQPPQNKQGNPEWLRYVLAHRAGENLTSTFTGIIEPYTATPNIARVQRLALENAPAEAQAVAVRVDLADGATDYLVSSADDTTVIRAEGGLEFAGGIGWLRLRDGHVERAALCRGTRLALGDFALTVPAPGQTGRIVRMDKDMEGKGYVWVDAILPLGETLRGQQMIIANDRQRNACYEIESVEQDGELYKVCLGEVSFIRGFRDPKDYGKGFVYDFTEGAEFIVPLTVWASRTEAGAYQLQSSGAVEVTPAS